MITGFVLGLLTNDSIDCVIHLDYVNSTCLFIEVNRFFIRIQIIHIQNNAAVHVIHLDGMNGFFGFYINWSIGRIWINRGAVVADSSMPVITIEVVALAVS